MRLRFPGVRPLRKLSAESEPSSEPSPFHDESACFEPVSPPHSQTGRVTPEWAMETVFEKALAQLAEDGAKTGQEKKCMVDGSDAKLAGPVANPSPPQIP